MESLRHCKIQSRILGVDMCCEISGEKCFFWTRRMTRVTSVSRTPTHIMGLGVRVTWKSVLLSPNRVCGNTFCCLTPGLLDVLHVRQSCPPLIVHNISVFWWNESKDHNHGLKCRLIRVYTRLGLVYPSKFDDSSEFYPWEHHPAQDHHLICLLWIVKARAKDKTSVVRGTGTPKDRDEVNRRSVCECEGWVWDLDVIGAPSRFRLIRKTAALVRIFPTLDLRIEEQVSRR